MTSPVYLDYNATAPLRPEAQEAMLEALDHVGNASSVHAFGRKARLWVEEARKEVAKATGAEVEEVVFTSGGTEGNVAALHGLPGTSVLVSATSHNSVLKNVTAHAFLPVHPSGLLNLEEAEKQMASAPRPFLVSAEWVNNETGVIHPVAELQALGKIPLTLRPDLLTLAAHKIGGPQGAGALVIREGVPFVPLIKGSHEKGRRGGTENVAGIAGFGAAVRHMTFADAAWRDEMEAQLLRVPGARIVGQEAPRVANTTGLVCPGLKAEILVMQLDMAGFAVSSGAACSSGKVTVSHVLQAMQCPESEQFSALRISFGWKTQKIELDSFVKSWTELALSAIR